MTNDDRRAAGVRRMPIEALVEICGRDVGGAAFEAESVEISGRGMHLRTAHLPEVGEPLVCRFEDAGREVIVEGVVAWREPTERGGEFGIKFTALDAASVAVLKELCGVELAPASAAPQTQHAAQPAQTAQAEGARVRLHIEGLGTPMKARVRSAGSKQVRVGSNLEFLKVGRHLDIEDMEAGEKRGAMIDAVSVALDPQTQVPQLVVSLCYDEPLESTPEPSVIDRAMDETGSEMAPGLSEAAVAGPADDELVAEANAMRGRLGVAASQAGEAVKRGGAVVARAGVAAAGGLGRMFRDAATRVAALRGGVKAEPRRTTSPAPGGGLNADGRRLRPQSPASAPAAVTPQPEKRRRGRRAAAIGIALALALGGGALAMRRPAEPPGVAAAEGAPKAIAAVGSAQGPLEVDETGDPLAPPPAAKLAPAPAAADPALGANPGAAPPGAAPPDRGGVVADVPLFGPTPMATMEPAPLGAAPGEEPPAPEPSAEERQEMAAANASLDEGFEDAPSASEERKTVAPQDVKPWGRGRVHMPTIHRIRLDNPGSAIQGAINPTGFTVVIPGRKAMENGKAIVSRDKRIAAVRARNGSSGAQISFQFKDGVPGYRVRLRKDVVEFLISAPEEKPVRKPEHAARKHDTSKDKKKPAGKKARRG